MNADDIFSNKDIGVYWCEECPDEFSIHLGYESNYISIDEAYILATNLLKKVELLRKVG
jgi:hypothetical protein